MQFSAPLAGTAPLNSAQLRAFLTVATLGGFTAAAKPLGLTQSAISHLIKTLETDLGCRLFVRAAGQVTLTPAGILLKEQAERILELMATTRAQLLTHAPAPPTRIRVGAPDMILARVLPDALQQWKTEQLPARPELVSAREQDILELVDTGQLDLGITILPNRGLEAPHRRLFRDELLLAHSPRLVVDPQAPQQETILLPSAETATGQLVRDWLAVSAVRFAAVIEVGESATALEMAIRGLGLCFLAPWEAEPELARGRLVLRPWRKRMLHRTWIMLHRRGRSLAQAEQRFCAAVVASVSALRKDRHDLPRRQ